MSAYPIALRPDPPNLAETLWKRYRTLADVELAKTPVCNGDAGCAREARGTMYLFVVDLVARWVDRVEREPDPRCREALIGALLAGGELADARRRKAV